jgi:hypothetical protein
MLGWRYACKWDLADFLNEGPEKWSLDMEAPKWQKGPRTRQPMMVQG